ncbi:MAG: hypothetical protein AAB592_05700 [Patescibacteria group bacterium]
MQTRICKASGKEFLIFDRDIEYYRKLSGLFPYLPEITLPTLCPEERTRRRFSFRNERRLFYRTCGLTGRRIVSNYSPESPYTIYSQEAWWSDEWNPFKYGRDIDFSRPFFEQFNELNKIVPQISLNVVKSERCEFNSYIGECKNCYQVAGSVYCEDCYYGSPYYSKDCVDSLLIRDCTLCYECVACDRCYGCNFCQDCVGSNDLYFCYDLKACRNCIGCAGLRNVEYHIFNKKYSKENYEKWKRENLDMENPEKVNKILEELKRLKLEIPHQYAICEKTENVTGNYIYESKNTHYAFDVKKCEDCSYVAQVVDMKDCYDNNYVEENEACYEYMGSYRNNRVLFSLMCCTTSDSLYSAYCISSSNLFGCVSVRHKQYCILNKQYDRDSYFTTVRRLADHMRETGEWGEFFPMSISPFPYEHTVAKDYF